MGKISRLTESDIDRLVKKIIQEQPENIPNLKACKSFFNQDTLKQAVDWWKNKVKDPNFQAKLLYNKFGKSFSTQKWNQRSGSFSAAEKKVMDNYTKELAKLTVGIEQRLNEITLSYYNMNDGAEANVEFFNKKKINVNCFDLQDVTKETAKSILIHEIQHCIDEFLGTDQNFVNGMLPPDFKQRQIKPTKIQYPNPEGKDNFDIGVEGRRFMDDFYFSKDKLRSSPHFKNVNYNCRPTEVASRMAQVREHLKLGVSQDLNLNHLRWDPKAYWLFYLNLLCWASRNDNVSLEDYISNLNLLAKNKSSSGSNMV